ncbi:hypothetical protein [Azonexus fungiphilus]|uniref:hypothetical protein n=1 Tax=Azonexus fungiphilus TaxID=146940 RepID=UPI000EB45F42|nr:hypothetical protein [Azonexus fungiphilus]
MPTCKRHKHEPGVDAQFTPPVERLTFTVNLPGEANLPGSHGEPLAAVLQVLESAGDYREVADHLPDIDITIR